MKISRWIYFFGGVFCLAQSAPILYSLISSGSSVLPDQPMLRDFMVFSLILFLLWAGLFFLISYKPSQYRSFMIPSIAAITTLNFLPLWLYFYGAGPWRLLRPVSYILALLFAACYLLELRQANQSAA